jgi:hypothetical protein
MDTTWLSAMAVPASLKGPFRTENIIRAIEIVVGTR